MVRIELLKMIICLIGYQPHHPYLQRFIKVYDISENIKDIQILFAWNIFHTFFFKAKKYFIEFIFIRTKINWKTYLNYYSFEKECTYIQSANTNI